MKHRNSINKLLLYLFLPLMLFAASSCSEPVVVENSFSDTGDSLGTIERKQTIVYDNGERMEIRYLGGTLESGRYTKFDAAGKVIEEGDYINGGFRKHYDESTARGEALLAMILFPLFIYLVFLYFKHRQAVIDWYRARKAGRE